MGIFGSERHKGISEYELTHDHVESRLHSVFPNTSIGRKKRAALDIAMTQALDKETPSSKVGVVTSEEFGQIVDDLKTNGFVSDNEVDKLHAAAEKALSD